MRPIRPTRRALLALGLGAVPLGLGAVPLALVGACTPVDAHGQPRAPRDRAPRDRAPHDRAPREARTRPTWGGLTVVERGAAEADRAFVLLHGWGAPGDDLVSLADELAALSHRPMRVIVPAAPIAMQHGGRAWYDLHADDATRQAARARGSIEAVVRTLGERGVAAEHVIVGGFSQGAILSIELALVGQPRVGGIAVLSGRALEHPARTYRALEHLPIFQSHGQSDDRIPFARGEAFREAATRAGASVEHVPFEGGHAIPPVVVTALAAWLERTLA